jgi:beta-phosphoglucomutase-like phosphatase (HAD superfamily)
MVDAALFELEGVVFDTITLRQDSLRSALAAQGIAIPLEPEIIDALVPRAAAAAALMRARMPFDDVLLDLVAAGAERAFSTNLATAGAELHEGARAFVESAACSTRVAIVTRAARADAQALLRLAGLEAVPAIMVCGDDVLDAKPSCEGYRLALDRLGRQRRVRLATVIALEHGAMGIRAALAAGLRCVVSGAVAPHIAIEADAYLPTLQGQTLKSVDELLASGREHVQ